MNELSKNWLGIAGIIVLLVFGWSALSAARSYNASIEPSSFRSFAVSAEGEITTIPDVANINFSVTTEGGKNVGALQKQNTEKMNTIIALLKSEGVQEADIKTTNYSINPRTQYFDCGSRILANGTTRVCPPPEVVGYTISQSVAVKIRDFEEIGDILKGVTEAGATGISDLHFMMDDPTEARAAARSDAIKKAQEQAEDIADAADFRLGRLLGIEEGGFDFERAYASDSYLKLESAAGA